MQFKVSYVNKSEPFNSWITQLTRQAVPPLWAEVVRRRIKATVTKDFYVSDYNTGKAVKEAESIMNKYQEVVLKGNVHKMNANGFVNVEVMIDGLWLLK